MARLLLYTVLGAVVAAIAVERIVAAPTGVSLPSPTFDFAQITAPPSLHELVKRQEAQTVLVGPDNTCGYVSGYLASAYTCNNVKAQCAFLTYSNLGAVACCNSATCGFVLDCVHYAQLATSSCGVSCQNDIHTLKCSRSATPYCGTATFFNGIKDYYCMTSRYSTAKQMLTTWIGEDDRRSFSPLVLTVTTSADLSVTQDGGLLGGGDAPATVTATSSTGSGSNNKDGNTDNNNKGGSSTPVGAIVGGVVGGVAVLIIVALALFFIIRHNNKKKQQRNAAAATNGGYPQMMQQPGGGPNNGPGGAPPAAGAVAGHQSVYNPAYQQQQQQQQQYPSTTQSPPPQHQQAPPYAYAGAGDMKPQAYATNAMAPPSPATSPGLNDQPSSPTMTDVSSIQPHHTGSTMGMGGGGAGYQYGSNSNNNGSGPNVPMTVHEAGGDAVGNYGPHSNHHGQFHEMQ
ncbi:hypothetical protein PG994_001269 [Apiospora phragmitis]|uniref:Uncharacterized protein n=1 Tax=Apiospora phragmitis TaxID=2905665 RepID=A0ABR1WT26_9PEZI